MKKSINLKRAQSSLEYALVIVCVVAALLAMQIYIKRSVQGRMRQTADSIGEQYAPGNTTSDTTLTINSNSDTTATTTELDGTTTTTTESDFDETQSRSGTETVGPLE